MSKKSTKKAKSIFDLNRSNLSFNEILQKQFPKYQVFLPDSEGKFEKCHETCQFLDACYYAYGVGKFLMTSDNGFSCEFDPDNYTEKDIKKAGYFEAFDFFVHNVLASYELDVWKKMIREKEMF